MKSNQPPKLLKYQLVGPKGRKSMQVIANSIDSLAKVLTSRIKKSVKSKAWGRSAKNFEWYLKDEGDRVRITIMYDYLVFGDYHKSVRHYRISKSEVKFAYSKFKNS